MAYSGITGHPAHLMVLGPYFEAHTYVIGYDQGVIDAIHERCRAFWTSLQDDTPPPLDDTVATYEAVRELHPDIDGTTVAVDPAVATRALQLEHQSKGLTAELRGAKTALLDAMGNAATAVVGDVVVATRRPHGHGGVALSLNTKNLTQLTTTQEVT